MTKFTQTYEIDAPVAKVWDALVNPTTIELWGAGPNPEMEAKEGSKFSLWGGDIYGTNTKVVENELLEQDWYGGKWDKPSKVTFELSSEGNKTTVVLTHSDFPEGEADDFSDGWKDYYMGPIKELLEDAE